MIKYISLKILKYFDYYYQIKLFNFLKKNNFKDFEIFFDIGAHEGESIILFSKNFNIKKIFSFEPSPVNFKKLSQNKRFIQNKFQNLEINLENYALGSEKKKLLMNQLSETSSSTINNIDQNSKYFKKKNTFLNLKKKNENFIKEVEIKQITLFDYIEQKKIPKIDFLKIDTEGYEFNVLVGMGKYLKNVNLIMFEHHYHDMLVKNYSFSDIHDLLKKNNFNQIFKYKMPFRKTFEYVYKKID
tara:strand:- start:1551 stop:2279 length:729 start_codon:yes stop_codon:yes gene_type:complete